MSTELSASEQAALEVGERIEASEAQESSETYTKVRESEQNELVFAGKYRTAAELERAYLALQKKLGSSNDSPDGQEEASEESEVEEDQEEAAEDVEEPTESSEEAPATLTSEEVEYILDNVGGEKNYTDACQWAQEALSQQEQEEFNSMIESGNLAATKFAVEALVNRYRDQADYQGKQIQGRHSTNEGVKPYRSQAEMVRDMDDPRYTRDPAFRNDVLKRAAATPEDLY